MPFPGRERCSSRLEPTASHVDFEPSKPRCSSKLEQSASQGDLEPMESTPWAYNCSASGFDALAAGQQKVVDVVESMQRDLRLMLQLLRDKQTSEDSLVKAGIEDSDSARKANGSSIVSMDSVDCDTTSSSGSGSATMTVSFSKNSEALRDSTSSYVADTAEGDHRSAGSRSALRQSVVVSDHGSEHHGRETKRSNMSMMAQSLWMNRSSVRYGGSGESIVRFGSGDSLAMRKSRASVGKSILMRSGSVESNIGADRGVLHPDWPANIEIREEFSWLNRVEDEESAVQERVFRSALSSGAPAMGRVPSMTFAPATVVHRTCVLDPGSSLRLSIDMVSIVVLVYDLTVIPYMLAWEDYSAILQWAGFITMLYWTLDIVISFRTGFYRKGDLEMRPHQIAFQYMRTWFFVDIFVVGLDWLSFTLDLIATEHENIMSSRGMRFFKIGRAVRIIGIVRISKGNKALEKFVERSMSSVMSMVVQVVKLMFLIVWLCHTLTCAWWAIGVHLVSDTGMRWIESLTNTRLGSPSYVDANTLYQYCTAFHWAVAQIASGSVLVTPLSSFERIFNILCLLFGMMFGSSLISSISAMMIQLGDMNKEQNNKLRVLRRYLRQEDVPPGTAMRVVKQATERLSKLRPLMPEDVSGLNLLSNSLRIRLHVETFGPGVMHYPLFRLWKSSDEPAFEQFCYKATKSRFLNPGDDLLLPGAVAEEVFYVNSGRQEYRQRPETSAVQEHTSTMVDPGIWICEAALWVMWFHVGSLEAKTDSQLITINVNLFVQIFRAHPLLREVIREYGRNFYDRITLAKPPDSDYPSDIFVPFTDYREIVISLSEDKQTLISMLAMKQLEHQRNQASVFNFGQKDLLTLKAEVAAGSCTLVEDADGAVERIVGLQILHLERADDARTLVELGKRKGHGHVKATCQLPATKCRWGEMPQDTLQRLIDENLVELGCELGQNVQLLRTAHRVEWGVSQGFGIRTMYLKTDRFARLKDADNFGRVPSCLAPIRVRRSSFKRVSMTPFVSEREKARYSEVQDLLSNPVYVVCPPDEEDTKYFYTWLDEDEFEYLSGAAGEQVRNWWVAQLDPNAMGSTRTSHTSCQTGRSSRESIHSRPDFTESMEWQSEAEPEIDFSETQVSGQSPNPEMTTM